MIQEFSVYAHKQTFEMRPGYKWKRILMDDQDHEALIKVKSDQYIEWCLNTFCCTEIIKLFNERQLSPEMGAWMIQKGDDWPILKSVKHCPFCGHILPKIKDAKAINW